MKKVIPLLALLLCTHLLIGQSINFSDMFLQPTEMKSGLHKGYARYDMGDYALYSSLKRNEPYFYIINSQNGKKIFSFQDPLESTKLVYHFFKSKKENSPIFIFCSAETNVSLGVYIFILEGNNIYDPGFISYLVDDYNFSSLGFHSMVNQVDENYEISFSDTDIIDYHTENVIDGNTIKFVVSKTDIEKIGN